MILALQIYFACRAFTNGWRLRVFLPRLIMLGTSAFSGFVTGINGQEFYQLLDKKGHRRHSPLQREIAGVGGLLQLPQAAWDARWALRTKNWSRRRELKCHQRLRTLHDERVIVRLTVRQHYVPQCYLKGFADPSAGREPGIWVVDGATGSITTLRPDAVAAIGDYYTVTLEGQRDDFIEEEFARLESNVTPILAGLQTGDVDLSDDKRLILCEFMAAQAIRVPVFRDSVEQLYVDITKKLSHLVTRDRDAYARLLRASLPEREFTDEEIDRVWNFARDPSRYTIRVNPETSIGHGLKLAESLVPIFASMRWNFLTSSGGEEFVTTDNPVSWANPEFSGFSIGHGLTAVATELVWPVGKSAVLVGTWRGTTGATVADADLIQKVNRRVISKATRYVFAPSERTANWANQQRLIAHPRNAHGRS